MTRSAPWIPDGHIRDFRSREDFAHSALLNLTEYDVDSTYDSIPSAPSVSNSLSSADSAPEITPGTVTWTSALPNDEGNNSVSVPDSGYGSTSRPRSSRSLYIWTEFLEPTYSADCCTECRCGQRILSFSDLRNHDMICPALDFPLFVHPERKLHPLTKEQVDEVASRAQGSHISTTGRETPDHGCQAGSTTIVERASVSSPVPPPGEKTLPSISNLIHPTSSGVQNEKKPGLNRPTPGETENVYLHYAQTKASTADAECVGVDSPTSRKLIVIEEHNSNNLRQNIQPLPRSAEEPLEQHVRSANSTNKIAPRQPANNDLAHEEQTEQRGYTNIWVDNILNGMSTLSGYSEDGRASRASDFGMEYDTTRATSDSEEGRIDTDSESFTWTEYSESSSEWDLSGAILTPMKLEYIERLLSSFSREWRSPATSDEERSGQSSESQSGKRRATSSPSSNSYESWPPKRSKRQPTNGDTGDGQGGDDDGNDPPNAPSNIAEDSQGTSLLFACPFVKRYPRHYYKCYCHVLKDVARVKYHLFRDKVHRLPIYCPNCSETFSSEDIRDEHVRAAKCTKKPPVKWEGITTRQREQLRKRSPATNSAVENWNAVYRILFPGDPLPSSPYIDFSLSEELRAFREYVLSEGPLLWDEILRSQLPENMQPHLEGLQSFHRVYFAEVITRLLETWNFRDTTIHSPQSHPSSSPTRNVTEALVGSTGSPTVVIPNASSRPDSALGNSVAGGSQSEDEPPPASENGVASPHIQQQQSTIQRGPPTTFLPQQTWTASGIPHPTPQTSSFIATQSTSVPLHARSFLGSNGQAEHGFPHLLYEPSLAPMLTLDLVQSFDGIGSTQPDPETGQFQYPQPSLDFPPSDSSQPYQM